MALHKLLFGSPETDKTVYSVLFVTFSLQDVLTNTTRTHNLLSQAKPPPRLIMPPHVSVTTGQGLHYGSVCIHAGVAIHVNMLRAPLGNLLDAFAAANELQAA